MAERKEEADADRPLAILEQLAGGVVDSRYVVGIEGVPQTEAVGQTTESNEGGVLAGRRQEQPPAGEVDEDDGGVEQGEADALAAVEVLREHLRNQGHGVQATRLLQ